MIEVGPAVTVEHVSTERLLLRELRITDFDTYARHRADPQSNEFIGGAVDRRRAWSIFASLTGAWMIAGAGWWGIELRGTRELIGTVGAFYRETSLPLGPESEIELGWTLFQPYWGNGYAKEAAAAALAFAFDRHRARGVIAQILPPNQRSIAVAKAIGMTFDKETDFYGEPILRFVRARPE